MRPTRERWGFTIVELMIVLAIIAIAAAIVAPSFIKHRQSVRMTVARNDLRVIAAAVDQLAFDSAKWPGGIPAGFPANPEVWNLADGSAGIVSNDGRFARWNGPYMKKVPADPWGANYFFDPDYRMGTTNYVVVGSFGPNGTGRNVYDDDDVVVVIH